MHAILSCCGLIIVTTRVVNFYAPSIMEEVSSLLSNAGFDTEIVQIFVSNKIDRSVLATLTTEDMKELGIVALGDRKKLQFLIEAVQRETRSSMLRTELSRLDAENPDQYDNHSHGQDEQHHNSTVELRAEISEADDFTSPLQPADLSFRDICEISPQISPEKLDITASNSRDADACGSQEDLRINTENEPAAANLPQATIKSTVPDYLEGWEHDFTVPTQFSETTMEVLTSGSMSKSARSEIVQMTASKMLNYCKYPTLQQYNEVGRKIVNDLLQGKKDTAGGSGYGSWSKALETRFRNVRRKPRSHTTGLEFVPTTKKKKIHLGNHSYNPFSRSLLDEKTYQIHISQLNKQLAKTTRNKTALKSLMIETAANRRKWIVEDNPSIKEVLSKFPLLKEFDMLLVDFCSATSIKDPVSDAVVNWNHWIPKIFHKAKLEAQNHKKTFKECIPIILSCADQPVDDLCKSSEAAFVLILLRKLLNSKMPKNCTELLIILEDGDEIEETVKNINATAPYVVQVGAPDVRQWFIAAEKEVLTCVEDAINAVIAMMAYYYVFDIAYPKEWSQCLLFIEKYLLGIKGGPELNPPQLGTISDIGYLSC